MRNGSRPLAADVLLGAAAGAAATWVMDRVTTAMYEREAEEARRREDKARGGKTAYVIAAEKAAAAAGITLGEGDEKKLGSAIHWALGIGAGAAYGLLRNRIPRLGIGSGIAYGIAFWLLMDEAGLTLLGLTPPPREFPWQAHARGAAGHVVLGAVTEAVFDASDFAQRA
ncbi:MAG: DUF1440 domain-containing protein [Thermoanaerobaculia bacterium]